MALSCINRDELTYVLDEHESLGIGDNLGGIQGLLQVIDESLLVTGELGGGAAEDLASLDTLILDRTEAASIDRLTNQGHGHTEIQRVHGSPLASALLASLVEDLLNKRNAVVVIIAEDVTRDLDQEGVKDTLVPLVEDLSDLGGMHAQTTLHNIVCLTDNKR